MRAATSSLYQPYTFKATENWRVTASGDPCSSSYTGGRWVVDFSRGASSISLAPPDRVLLGSVVRLRLRGNAAGHPLRIYLRIHFMTFNIDAGEITASGEHEIVLDGPPVPSWKW